MKYILIVDLVSGGIDFAEYVLEYGYKLVMIIPPPERRMEEIPEKLIRTAKILIFDGDFEADDPPDELIAELMKYKNIEGIFPGCEFGIILAAKIGKRLGIRTNSIEVAGCLRNKLKQRQILQKNNFLTPKYYSFSNQEELSDILEMINYPAVLKPTEGVGKFGVSVVRDKETLFENYLYEKQILNKKTKYCNIGKKWLVEEYITGGKYNIDLLVFGENDIHPLVIYEGTVVGDNFIEIGHALPAELTLDQKRKVEEAGIQCTRAFNIIHGVVHLEFFFQPEGEKIYIIELNGRLPGGKVPQMVNKASGNDYFKLAMDAVIENGDSPKIKPFDRYVATHWICRKSGRVRAINQFDEIDNEPGFLDKYLKIRVGDILEETFDGDDRIGYSMNEASTLSKAKQYAKKAVEKIEIIYE